MLFPSLTRPFSPLHHHHSPFLLPADIQGYIHTSRDSEPGMANKRTWGSRFSGSGLPHSYIIFSSFLIYLKTSFFLKQLKTDLSPNPDVPLLSVFLGDRHLLSCVHCHPIHSSQEMKVAIGLEMFSNWWIDNESGVHIHYGMSFLLFKLLMQKLDDNEGGDWNHSQGAEMLFVPENILRQWKNIHRLFLHGREMYHTKQC